MADKNLFNRLKRLFSTNVVIRNVGGKRLKVTDTGLYHFGNGVKLRAGKSLDMTTWWTT